MRANALLSPRAPKGGSGCLRDKRYEESCDTLSEHAFALARLFVTDFYGHASVSPESDHELAMKVGADFLELAARSLRSESKPRS